MSGSRKRGRGGKWRDIGQRVPTFGFKLMKFWGSIFPVVTLVSNNVEYILEKLLSEVLNVLTTQKKIVIL